MSAETDTAEIQVASVKYERTDGQLTLLLETKDRVKVEFILGPVAVAMLMLTLSPTAKLALHDLEKDKPRPEAPAAPDSPEGLEG